MSEDVNLHDEFTRKAQKASARREKLLLRSAYDGREKEFSRAAALFCPEPTRTQQQFKDQNNPNKVMDTFARTGDPSVLMSGRKVVYGDFTDVVDYKESLERVIRGQEMFFSLPAEIRDRFKNDPAQLLDFVQDEANRDEAIKLGLIEPEKPSSPTNRAGTASSSSGVPTPDPAPSSSKTPVSGAGKGGSVPGTT